MEKGNKIRFIFWGFIWLIVIVLTSYGMYSYFNGYGISGKLRKKLTPIVETFNNLNKLKDYSKAGIEVKASILKNGIKISYTTTTSTLNFIYKYEYVEDEEVLYTKYNMADETAGLIVAEALFDSIAVKNNHREKELFEKYEFGELYKSKIKYGGYIENDSNDSLVYVNINKTLLDTMTEDVVKDLYINETDLMNLKNELAKEDTYTYKYEKGNTKLYIEITNDKYILYLRNGEYDNYLYKSIVSTIDSLDISDEKKQQFIDNYKAVDSSTYFDNYIITIDSNVSTLDFFTEKDKVVKIEINKDKENETKVEPKKDVPEEIPEETPEEPNEANEKTD